MFKYLCICPSSTWLIFSDSILISLGFALGFLLFSPLREVVELVLLNLEEESLRERSALESWDLLSCLLE